MMPGDDKMGLLSLLLSAIAHVFKEDYATARSLLRVAEKHVSEFIEKGEESG